MRFRASARRMDLREQSSGGSGVGNLVVAGIPPANRTRQPEIRCGAVARVE